MKLSEILGWGDKKVCRSCNGTRIIKTVFQDECCPHCHLVYQWNEALTSCDREIDREALWKLIVSRSVYHNFDSDKDNFITVPLNDLTDLIISTMPTWLKRSEGE